MVKAKVFHEILQCCGYVKLWRPECESLSKRKLRLQAKFLSVAQRNRPARLVPGSVTEICGRDFLNLVLRIGNSNEIPERQ
jgi:hypothetical protein